MTVPNTPDELLIAICEKNPDYISKMINKAKTDLEAMQDNNADIFSVGGTMHQWKPTVSIYFKDRFEAFEGCEKSLYDETLNATETIRDCIDQLTRILALIEETKIRLNL